jgi:hypothetical protein
MDMRAHGMSRTHGYWLHPGKLGPGCILGAAGKGVKGTASQRALPATAKEIGKNPVADD